MIWYKVIQCFRTLTLIDYKLTVLDNFYLLMIIVQIIILADTIRFIYIYFLQNTRWIATIIEKSRNQSH